MYDRILIPTDGSKATDSIIEQAIEYAQKFDAEIHCLYVMVHNTTLVPEGQPAALYHGEKEVGEDALSVLEEAIPDDIDVVTEIGHGTAHTAICEYAATNDIDLIMMGTRGCSGIQRLLTGSVTENVLRSTDVPVLVLHR